MSEPRRLPRPQQQRREITGFQPNGRIPGLPLPTRPDALPPYDTADVYALKALRDGTASPEQQRRALAWIVEYACRTYGPGWHAESERLSGLDAGCRQVGRTIVNLLNARVEANEEQGR